MLWVVQDCVTMSNCSDPRLGLSTREISPTTTRPCTGASDRILKAPIYWDDHDGKGLFLESQWMFRL